MKKYIILLCLSTFVLGEELSTIIVDTEKFEEKTSLNQVLSSKEIENMVTNNGDIPSLLKTNPNVKIRENNYDPSSIEPAKIEINNAKYYQNSFLVDGVSASSLLDPNSYNRVDDVKGNESEFFLDLDLIESIKVYDSGISAEYGSFSGGVIDVKLKNPSAVPSGKIKYRYTSDNFAKIHYPKDANSTISSKPEFEKRSMNATYSGPINDSSGLIFSYSDIEGKKPVRYLDTYKTAKNSSSNFLVKYSRYLDDDGIADFALSYSPYKSNNITGRYIKDSEYKIKGGGINLYSNFQKNFNEWRFDSNISLKMSENTRNTNNSYLKHWRKTNSKNWGNSVVQGESISSEGSWGDIEKTQKSIISNFKLKKDFEKHFLNTGLELNFIQGSYKREDELMIYKDPISDSGIRCNGYTEDCIQREQFFTRRDIYQKEDVSANMFALAYYLEDKYKTKYADFQFGLRTDYNNYLKNFDLAPRLNTQIHFFDKKTKIYLGLNRYYGKSFLSSKLREARTPYKSEYRSKFQDELNSDKIPQGALNPTVWGTSSDKGSDKYLFSDLKTPYTDEKSIGLSQAFFNNVVKLKYVHRDAKNQFTMKKGERQKFTRPDGKIAYYYPRFSSNDGESNSKIYTITLQNINPIKMYSSELNYSLSYRKSKHNTNFVSYDSNTDNKSYYVKYNKKTVESSVIKNYTRPDNYSFLLNFKTPNVEFFNLNGTLNSTLFFTYTPSYMKPTSTGETTDDIVDDEFTILSIYEDKKIKDNKNVDLKLSLDVAFSSTKRLRVSADILNLFDKVNDDLSNSYELGRQYWLGLEYKF